MEWEVCSEPMRPEQALSGIAWDCEGHDAIQKGMPEPYTHLLAMNRDMVYNPLQKCLRSELGHHLSGKSVLELGPGAANILYNLLGGGSSTSWTAMDISPSVVGALKRYQERSTNYRVVQGTFRRLPFATGSLDVVCGLCSLDSIIDFDSVGAEILRVLRPGGRLIHVQDLPPSRATLESLIAREQPGKDFVLHALNHEDGGKRGPALLSILGGGAVDAHDYLHEGLEREFASQGLCPLERHHRTITRELWDEYWLVRNMLGLAGEENMNCSCSVLIMGKPGELP